MSRAGWTLVLWLLAGCSGTVTPPRSPPHPTTVLLCDYGYHSSLLLPVGNGAYVEYLFGDWQWAAENDTGVVSAVRAGLFSSQATLGRRHTNGPHTMTTPHTAVPITIDADRAAALQAELDARWRRHMGDAVYAGSAGAYYVFVPDDAPYSLRHNCNRATADWLDRLGCDTGGLPILSHFTVEPSTP